MPYIKNIASIVGKADSGGGGSKKDGLVYGSDWRRVPRKVLKSSTTNTILACMLKNCRRVPGCVGNGDNCFLMGTYTRTYINKRGRNNTFK